MNRFRRPPLRLAPGCAASSNGFDQHSNLETRTIGDEHTTEEAYQNLRGRVEVGRRAATVTDDCADPQLDALKVSMLAVASLGCSRSGSRGGYPESRKEQSKPQGDRSGRCPNGAEGMPADCSMARQRSPTTSDPTAVSARVVRPAPGVHLDGTLRSRGRAVSLGRG
jgi:hypothetical protein